jgi:hypothetical protein
MKVGGSAERFRQNSNSKRFLCTRSSLARSFRCSVSFIIFPAPNMSKISKVVSSKDWIPIAISCRRESILLIHFDSLREGRYGKMLTGYEKSEIKRLFQVLDVGRKNLQ